MVNRKHDIEKYLRGELTPAEMHALEKAALSDPFLAEALEGIDQAGADNFLYDLHKINRSVHDRMRRKIRGNSKVVRIWGWTTAVAATILLIAVSGFLVINILRDQQSRERGTLSSNEDQKSDADSSATTGTGEELALAEKKQEEAPPVKEVPPPDKASPPTRRERITPVQPPITARDQSDASAATKDQADNPVVEETTTSDHIAFAEEQEELQPQAAESRDRDEPAQAPTIARSEQERVESQKSKNAPALDGRASGVVLGSTEPSKKSSPARVVKGKVIDEGGRDLPGVSVNIPGTSIGVVTDGEGQYEVNVPTGTDSLVFAFIGFETKQVPIGKLDRADVTLEEDVSALSEVVITTGRGSPYRDNTVDDAFQSAEPDGGKNDFKDYLAGAVRYPQEAIKNKIEGKVTIRFTVEPSGQLTNFEVVKGIGSGCEEELIRAIRQGPYWKPGKVGTQPVKDQVRVRFKFHLPK